jgi:hypothetical protein
MINAKVFAKVAEERPSLRAFAYSFAYFAFKISFDNHASSGFHTVSRVGGTPFEQCLENFRPQARNEILQIRNPKFSSEPPAVAGGSSPEHPAALS